MLRDRVAQVMPHWSAGAPGYGYVLGMHAFGLEETGLYDRAEATGRRALDLNRRDPWAVHAVTHVMEMQGRLPEGIAWLTTREADWAPDNGFAFHNWWHLALYHLDLGDTERVLEIYDSRIRPQPSAVVLEMIDATAMLWRLHLRGIAVGDRWRELASAWEPLAEDGYYSFNDAHAMMAFVADGRAVAARRLLATLERAAAGAGTNAAMAREVGLPLARALAAFGAGDYAAAVPLLARVRPVASRFGGSNAQRDIIALTLIEAALRAGQTPLARALAAERTDLEADEPVQLEHERAGPGGHGRYGRRGRRAAHGGVTEPSVDRVEAAARGLGLAAIDCCRRPVGRRQRLDLPLQIGERLARALELLQDLLVRGWLAQFLQLFGVRGVEIVDHHRDEEVQHDEGADQHERHEIDPRPAVELPSPSPSRPPSPPGSPSGRA